jgi:exonuclease III
MYKYITILCLLLSLCTAKADSGKGRLKILSYNVYEGFLNDTAVMRTFLNWVDTLQPDVVAFQEMQHMTQQEFGDFAKRCGFPYAVLLKEKGFPVALASRYPITGIEKVTENMHHGFIYAMIEGYHFLVIHLSPVTYIKRVEEVYTMLAFLQAKHIDNEKLLVMGDFNNLSPQDSVDYDNPHKMKLMTQSEINHPGQKSLNNGMIDYTAIHTMLTAGFTDTWKLFHTQYEKSAPTKVRKHTNYSRIDYIWVNEQLKKNCAAAYLVKDGVTDYLSDHYPMVLVLNK